ncbi:hypothetical protein PG985_010518 [Apiospora marii]|uniref:uncharacterized protein n=1 Tax=Apiospora marii TaxID=335849 RepID=UPI00312FC329
MKLTAILLVFGVIADLGCAEVVDFGQLDKYDPHLTTLPLDVGLNNLWVGHAEGGYDFVLSPDVKDKVHGVLEGCGDINEQCYKDVQEVLTSAGLGFDRALGRRDLAHSLSTAFKGRAALVDANAMLVWLEWKLKHQKAHDLGLWIPDSIASEAGALATARVVTISAEGSPVITITQTPAVTKRQGSTVPSVTAVTEPKNNYVSGDLIACLDQDLASRIGEMMDRTTHCSEGEEFDKKHHDSKKRAQGTYGKSICASIAVAGNAAPGGPFNDLLLLSPNSLPFGFADLASAAAQASRIVISAVQALTELVSLGPELSEQLALYIFALALDKVYEGLPLGEENRIRASMVTTMAKTATATATTTTTTATGCPDPTKTPLVCGVEHEDCQLQFPTPPKQETTCKEGQYKGCDCKAPSSVSIDLVSPEEQKAIVYLTSSHTAPQADCPMNADTEITPIPATLFASEKHNISNHFCERWHSDTSSYMMVDSSGNNKDPDIHLRGRTPPPSAGDWKDWDFNLFYTPSKGGSGAQLIVARRSTGSPAPALQILGELDVGCGNFGYNIHRAKAELREYDRVCYKKDDFVWKGPISSGHVTTIAHFYGCPDPDKPVRKDDKSTFRHAYYVPGPGGEAYQFNIWWKEGCTLDNGGPSEALIANPLDKSPSDRGDCIRYMLDNYRECNNGGVGGTIQVGCLIYEFKADTSERGRYTIGYYVWRIFAKLSKIEADSNLPAAKYPSPPPPRNVRGNGLGAILDRVRIHVARLRNGDGARVQGVTIPAPRAAARLYALHARQIYPLERPLLLPELRVSVWVHIGMPDGTIHIYLDRDLAHMLSNVRELPFFPHEVPPTKCNEFSRLNHDAKPAKLPVQNPAWKFPGIDTRVRNDPAQGTLDVDVGDLGEQGHDTPGPTGTLVSSAETGSATGLQTGAAVGIGIGVTLAFVAVVAAAVFLCLWMRRRRRQRKSSEELTSSPLPQGPFKPEPHSEVIATSAPPPTQDVVPNYHYAQPPGYELDAREPDPELPVDRQNTPEMPATSPRGFRM